MVGVGLEVSDRGDRIVGRGCYCQYVIGFMWCDSGMTVSGWCEGWGTTCSFVVEDALLYCGLDIAGSGRFHWRNDVSKNRLCCGESVGHGGRVLRCGCECVLMFRGRYVGRDGG